MGSEKDGCTTTETHGRAHTAALFGAMLGHVDDYLLLLVVQILGEFGRVGAVDAADVASEFDRGALHAQTDACRIRVENDDDSRKALLTEEWNVVFACPLARYYLSFNASLTETSWYKHTSENDIFCIFCSSSLLSY